MDVDPPAQLHPQRSTTTTILGSFLGRGRPRNTSQGHIDIPANANSAIGVAIRDLSPSPPGAMPPSPGLQSPNALNAHNANAGGSARRRAQQPVSAIGMGMSGAGLSGMLRRRRSAGALVGTAGSAPTPGVPAPMPLPPSTAAAAVPPPVAPAATANNTANAAAPTHRLRLVPHLDSRRSLRFDPIARDLRAGEPALRIGRFTDRSGLGLSAVNALSTNKIAFKSNVVSRAHAEVWVDGASGGVYTRHEEQFRDVHQPRPPTESRPHQIKDGDILQLGFDYQGGVEDSYESVKIRIEPGREWQAGVNAFNPEDYMAHSVTVDSEPLSSEDDPDDSE
ncbi:hypothetical protein C8J57DRAFT_1560761 [Mycena rebaudengoi]|nr:hypothetical protein C8J57DRAFT_1560761 [Mycena rebaudengoi]